jgi:hypothetical protein
VSGTELMEVFCMLHAVQVSCGNTQTAGRCLFHVQSRLVNQNQNEPPFWLQIVKGSDKQVDATYIAVEMNRRATSE